jgi:RNA polymerase sigma factor (sigma-70 family)
MKAEFPSTMRTLIHRAGAGDRGALERLSTLYREPVYTYLRNQGLKDADAEDVTQQVFETILEDGVFAKWDASKGRFRHFLVGLVRNVAKDRLRREGAKKRGGGKRRISIDTSGPDGDAPISARVSKPAGDDEEFDKLWMLNLVRHALEGLKVECVRQKVRYHEALERYVFGSQSYTVVAKEMGVQVHDVKNWIHRARARLVPHVQRLILETCRDPGEYQDEQKYLMKLMPA